MSYDSHKNGFRTVARRTLAHESYDYLMTGVDGSENGEEKTYTCPHSLSPQVEVSFSR